MKVMRMLKHNLAQGDLKRENARPGEEGYTLVALLALMTILAVIMLAVTPNIRQQAQREREKEAIFRGEQVAEAIGLYFKCTNGQLPTSMDQLLEGAPCRGGSKKLQMLRPEAAIDPLSSSGEWRLIRPRGREMIDFKRAVMEFAHSQTDLRTTDQNLAKQFDVQVVNIIGTGSKESTPIPGAELGEENFKGPFIGVASRSSRDSIITYYGIEHHNGWIFTPLYR
jgi:type II secretory pathway pseudopilin PulG